MVRIASADIDYTSDWRVEKIYQELFKSCLMLGSDMEDAACSSDRFEFRFLLHQVHSSLRQVKLYLKLLDDLGRIEPEAAVPLRDAAEEIHRLVIAALATSKADVEPSKIANLTPS